MKCLKERLFCLIQYGSSVYTTDESLITENSTYVEKAYPDRCFVEMKDSRVVARFGELYAAYVMECLGFEVAWPEIDDHGIDFIVLDKSGKQLMIQVKTVRYGNYIYIKEKNIDKIDYLVLVRIDKQNYPNLYIYPVKMITNTKGKEVEAQQLFKYRDYKDEPEYGVSTAERFFVNSEYLYAEKGTWNIKMKNLPIG